MNLLVLAQVLLLILCVLIVPSVKSQASTQPWSTGTDMPTARAEIAVTNIGNDIYVIGGMDRFGDPMDVVEVYDVKKNSWKSVSSLPRALHHTAAASFNGKIYVVGGFISNEWIPTNQLFVYDPIKNKWSEGKSMPTARGALTALFVNGTLYAMGGQSHRVLDINEAYDAVNGNWVTKAPMQTARHHAASAAVDNEIYVIGGRTTMSSATENVNTNEVYDTKTEKWTGVQAMPSERSGIWAAAINNSFFVFGGEDLTRIYGNNEEYDTQRDTWSSREPMPTPRHGLGAVSVDHRIFVIGGGREAGLSISDINEIYSPGAKRN